MLSVKWKTTWRNVNQLRALNSHIRQRENLDNCARTLGWIPQRNPKQGDTCWTATVCLWTPCTDDTRSWNTNTAHPHLPMRIHCHFFCFDQICWKIILVVNKAIKEQMVIYRNTTSHYKGKVLLKLFFMKYVCYCTSSKRFTYYQPWVSRAKSGILSAMGYTHSEQLPFSTSLRVSCSWYEQSQIHSISKYSDKMVIMDITR